MLMWLLPKRLVVGYVAIDLLPVGRDELLVIGDETANPGFVAADLLAQAGTWFWPRAGLADHYIA